MRKMHSRSSILLSAAVWVALIGPATQAHAIIIGSDTTPSRQSSILFPASSTNLIMGFAWMTGGFTLLDSGTLVNWNSVFPASGDILLNGGTLKLLTNMTLAPDANIMGGGTLDLGGKTMSLEGDWTVGGAIALPSSGIIDGGGHAVTLSGTGTLAVGSGQSVRLRNMSIRGLASGRLAMADQTCSLILENVELNLDSNCNLTVGTLSAAGSVVIRSTAGAAFSITGGTFRIQSHAICRVDLETVLTYASTSGNKHQLVFEDATARLVVDGGSLLVAQDLQLLKGQLVLQKSVSIQISAGKSLEIGDGVFSNNLDLVLAPDAVVNSNGIITNKNV